jgi:hypothetical protein
MAKITYTDKVNLKVTPVADINKVKAEDVNEIKDVVNGNDDILTDHIDDTANPHNVTKSQIGLGNVNNTSDANKPISTATQTALNGKQDTLVSGTTIKTVNSEGVLGSGNLDLRGDFRAVGPYNAKNVIQNKPILFPAINFVDGNAAPPTSFTDDIFVLDDLGNGAVHVDWDGAPYNSWVINGTGGVWFAQSPTNGATCYDKTAGVNKRFNGSAWVEQPINATHTGEVTGATALTVNKVAITNKTLVTLDPLDHILIADASDSDNLKKVLASDFGGAGKVAIYDANGKPTFYTTLTAAFAAATSGSTIQLMTSMTETLTTVLTIPFGVNINLNGNTLTINQNNANTSFQTDVSTGYVGQFINGTIKRTNGSGGIISVSNSSADAQIDFTGLFTDYTGGLHFASSRTDSEIKFRGLSCKGTTNTLVQGACGIENFTAKVTSGICFDGVSNASKCIANATSGRCYNSSTVFNSFGKTVSGNVYQACTVKRSYGESSTGNIYDTSSVIHSEGISGSGYGLVSGTSEHSKLTSTSNNATTGSKTTFCELRSDTTYTANMGNNSIVKFCIIICNWNNSGARGIVMGTNCEVEFNTIKMANLSSYAIGFSGNSSSGGINIARGCAAVYDPAHTQLTSNSVSSPGGNLLA